MRTVGPYSVVDTKDIYTNPWISVHEDRVIRPDGAAAVFGIVEMKAGSSVLALDNNGDVLLIREFKYAVERETLEVISGGVEIGESPLEAAKRELREEAGYEASEWLDLGAIDPFTTAIRSRNYMFMALHLTRVERQLDEGEILETVRVPLSEAVRMVLASEITHGASCTLLLKAERYRVRDIEVEPTPPGALPSSPQTAR